MVLKKILLVLTCFIFFIYHASYAMPTQTPEALWRTYDLKGQARSVLKFYIIDGELRADVVKILMSKGHLKNKPYLGMTIIRGLKFKNNKWINGEVLDTDTGNIYSCNITLSHDGQTMHLHAYKGISLFGRTVHWKREPVN